MNRKKPRRRHAALVRHNRKQQIVVASPQPQLPDTSEERMLKEILRAARDPKTDVAKLNALTAWVDQRRLAHEQRHLDDAIRRCKAQASVVVKTREADGNRWRYAALVDIDAMLSPLYGAEGIRISYNEDITRSPVPDHKLIECIASYGLARDVTHWLAPIDTKGPKGNDVMTRTHAGASATKLARRIALEMKFNVQTRDRHDDDGQAAGRSFDARIDAKQAKKIRDRLKEVGRTEKDFCIWKSIDAVEGLSADDYEDTIGQMAVMANAQQRKKEAVA